MRAITVSEYGATPAIAEVPMPEPGEGQVLLKLRDAGMNPMDRTLASGDWKPMPATFPMVLGADGAGVVEKLGEGASRFSVGDDVFGQLLIAPLGSAGTYAEYVAVSEDAPVAKVPPELDDVVAAALPTAGGAGLALVDLLEPLTDKTVLIVGAGGGVGSFATQFAVNAGREGDRERTRPRKPSACALTVRSRPSITQRSRCPRRYDRHTPTASTSVIDLVSRRRGFAALAPAGAIEAASR